MLGSFLEDYTSNNSTASKENRNCESILKSLEFPGMDARRDQIQDAARDTFEWLLEEDSIPDGHDDLETSLKEWLATGAGVYHITGKPGSGKSTLMKLVGESYKSHTYLQDCARRDQKQLITVNFFTWKAAESNRLQNKVEGMIRTLLHQILTLEPGLISRVFPEHWHPETYHVHSTSKEIKLRWPEIQKASERIFGSPLLIRKYRIFLLIDGMDEFDDPGEPHFQIAKRVKEWCARNPDSVKACVSSREDSPFMDTFPSHQRLRLHLVTSGDIRRLTKQRLMEHPYFVSSSFTHDQRAKLIHSVTERAEGVFLWVVLTIVELTYRLDARQGFDSIREVVEDSNQNLNTFIKEILSRIPDTYSKDAQNLFRIVQFTTRASFALDLFRVHKAVTYAKEPGCLIERVHRTVTYEEAVGEVEEFKSRLSTVSRGLLELRPLDGYDQCVLAGPHARFSVSFTHRSVFDFFEENAEAIWKEDLADDALEGSSLIIRSSAHVAYALPWQQPDFGEIPPRRPVRHWRHFIIEIMVALSQRDVDNTTVESYFAPLKALDEALLHKQGILPGDVQLDSSQWSDVRLPTQGLLHNTASVFLSACTEIWHTIPLSDHFVSWAVNGGYPGWIQHPVYKARIAQACFPPVVSSRDSSYLQPWDIHPVFLGVNEVLEADILPKSIPFSSNLRGSLWLNYLVYTINLVARYQLRSEKKADKFAEVDGEGIAYELLLFLQCGVEPCMLFHWWPKGVDTQRSDCVHPYKEAQDGTRVASPIYPSPAEGEDSPDDNTWEGENTIRSNDPAQEGGTLAIAATRSSPLDADFGLEVTVGTAPKRHLSQGPRWPREQDTFLLRFFLFNFGTTTGTASQVDVLKIISSLTREMAKTYPWTDEARFERLDSAIAALGQATVQDIRPDFSGFPVDCNRQLAPEIVQPIDTGAQNLTVTGTDQAKTLYTLALDTVLRGYRMIVLPILGKYTSPVTALQKSIHRLY